VKVAVEDLHDPPAGDEAAIAELEVEEPRQPDLVELSRPSLERIEPAAEIDAADERANRGAADDVGLDAHSLKRPQDADMRPSPSHSAAQG